MQVKDFIKGMVIRERSSSGMVAVLLVAENARVSEDRGFINGYYYESKCIDLQTGRTVEYGGRDSGVGRAYSPNVELIGYMKEKDNVHKVFIP